MATSTRSTMDGGRRRHRETFVHPLMSKSRSVGGPTAASASSNAVYDDVSQQYDLLKARYGNIGTKPAARVHPVADVHDFLLKQQRFQQRRKVERERFNPIVGRFSDATTEAQHRRRDTSHILKLQRLHAHQSEETRQVKERRGRRHLDKGLLVSRKDLFNLPADDSNVPTRQTTLNPSQESDTSWAVYHPFDPSAARGPRKYHLDNPITDTGPKFVPRVPRHPRRDVDNVAITMAEDDALRDQIVAANVAWRNEVRHAPHTPALSLDEVGIDPSALRADAAVRRHGRGGLHLSNSSRYDLLHYADTGARGNDGDGKADRPQSHARRHRTAVRMPPAPSGSLSARVPHPPADEPMDLASVTLIGCDTAGQPRNAKRHGKRVFGSLRNVSKAPYNILGWVDADP